VVGIAHAASGSGTVSHVGVGAAALAFGFVALEVVSMRSCQLALEGGTDATAIVTGSMFAAGAATLPFALLAQSGADRSTLTSAVLAAGLVAVLGTLGRVLRTAALPAAGVPAVAASTQVTALGTALGGVVLFSDLLGPFGAACGLLAAGLGVVAVVAGTQWRLARDMTLARPFELRPDPVVD
jgi:hypothetical protein